MCAGVWLCLVGVLLDGLGELGPRVRYEAQVARFQAQLEGPLRFHKPHLPHIHTPARPNESRRRSVDFKQHTRRELSSAPQLSREWIQVRALDEQKKKW